MADVFDPPKHQSLLEIRQWDVDFALDLAAGVTVASATARHVPPSGAATTPTVGVIASPYVPVKLGPLAVLGKHLLYVLATYSNGEKSEACIRIHVEF